MLSYMRLNAKTGDLVEAMRGRILHSSLLIIFFAVLVGAPLAILPTDGGINILLCSLSLVTGQCIAALTKGSFPLRVFLA